MKPKIIRYLFFAFCVGFFLSGSLPAKEDPKADKTAKSQGPLGVTGTPTYGMVNINNWVLWLESNGRSAYNPFISGDGGIFPKGTTNVIFQDGFIFGSKLIDTRTGQPPPSEVIRVGGQTYNIGTVAGAVVSGVPENPASPSVRLYRIRRDYNDVGVDLRADAADFFNKSISAVTDADIATVKAQFDKDWKEWPVSKGAPYIDRNNNGKFDPPPAGITSADLIAKGYDEPGLAAADPNSPADQVMWTVCNDFNDAASRGLYGSPPTGIELQITVWGYKRSDALGNVLFRKYRMINKGFFRSDSMYVSQWSDPDLGDFGDDFAGCDTTASLGFVWNGEPIDREYRKFGLPPASGGYVFFQGPLVPGAASDVGIFDLKKRTGFKNLRMTSFGFFSAGAPISDPPLTQYEGALRWYRMLQGFVADPSTQPARRFVDNLGRETLFPLAGDPVTNTGWIDGVSPAFPPGDRRIYLNSGPFKIAPGDTQEVVVGIVGGLGADRISSIAVMKFNNRFAQNTYNALFAVPSPPNGPIVVLGELDGQIVLDWGSNAASVAATENTVKGTYVFQGYDVYQFPSRTSTLKDAVKIATYDVIDGITVVLDDQFDAKTGQILRLPVQVGSDNGIKRFQTISTDAVHSKPRLNNGQEYYFAVTAYAVSTNPSATPISLESTPNIITVIPQSPKPGVRYAASAGDPTTVTHKAGTSDGIITATVVNPAKTTGDQYDIVFHQLSTGDIVWDLKDVTQNRVVVTSSNQGSITSGNLNDDFNYPTVDGIYVTVSGPPPGMKDWSIPSGRRRFTFADADGWGFEGFFGAIGWDDPAHFFGNAATQAEPATKLKNVLIKLAVASSSTQVNPNTNIPYAGWDRNATTDSNMSYAYRYLRRNALPPALPEFAPYIINTTGGYAYQDYTKGVPFAAFDVEANPPRRLAVGFLENNVANGLVDGRWWPPPNGAGVTNTEGSGPREWAFIFDSPYAGATPDPSLQKDILNTSLPVMWWLTVNRRGGTNFPGPSGADQFLILANHVNTPADVFEYAAPAAATPTTALALEDVKKINVFPNPYYAFNAAETNRFVRFVTFNFLPTKATIRIFNLAGQLVRTFEKNDGSQFLRWDLNNQNNFPVASGMYIVHITMPDLGATKILKLAIIQEQEILEIF